MDKTEIIAKGVEGQKHFSDEEIGPLYDFTRDAAILSNRECLRCGLCCIIPHLEIPVSIQPSSGKIQTTNKESCEPCPHLTEEDSGLFACKLQANKTHSSLTTCAGFNCWQEHHFFAGATARWAYEMGYPGKVTEKDASASDLGVADILYGRGIVREKGKFMWGKRGKVVGTLKRALSLERLPIYFLDNCNLTKWFAEQNTETIRTLLIEIGIPIDKQNLTPQQTTFLQKYVPQFFVNL